MDDYGESSRIPEHVAREYRTDVALEEAMYDLRKLVRVWVGRWYTRNGSLANLRGNVVSFVPTLRSQA